VENRLKKLRCPALPVGRTADLPTPADLTRRITNLKTTAKEETKTLKRLEHDLSKAQSARLSSVS